MIRVNREKIDYSLFPNGEMLVDTGFIRTLRDTESRAEVECTWTSNEELLHLYFVLSYLKDNRKIKDLDLIFSYMPYSRMDRSQEDSCFTLKYIINLICSVLSPNDNVLIVEPHSKATYDLFCEHLSNRNVFCLPAVSRLAEKVLSEHPEIDVICYPDKGARLRYALVGMEKPIVYCEKIRVFETGEITGLNLISQTDLKGKAVLIVDDLCSKGGTFFHTANKLLAEGASSVYLAVCHVEETIIHGELVKDTSPLKHVYGSTTMIDSLNGYDNITLVDWRELCGKSY